MRIDRARKARRSDEGLTLIELLVVVLIIGILSAVSIPIFAGQIDKAYEAQVQSDLEHAVTAAQSFAISSQGSFDSLTMDDLADFGYTSTPDVSISIASASEGEFTLRATHGRIEGTTTWTFDASSGRIVKSD